MDPWKNNSPERKRRLTEQGTAGRHEETQEAGSVGKTESGGERWWLGSPSQHVQTSARLIRHLGLCCKQKDEPQNFKMETDIMKFSKRALSTHFAPVAESVSVNQIKIPTCGAYTGGADNTHELSKLQYVLWKENKRKRGAWQRTSGCLGGEGFNIN